MPPTDTADKTQQPPLMEYVWLLVLSTMWGASFSFLKLTVGSIPPLTAIAVRTMLAGAVLMTIMRWQGLRLPRDRPTWKSFITVSAINTVFPFILIAWGLTSVDASLAVILNSTTPIFAFLITWLLTRQETVTPRRLFGVIAGITGIVLIVGMSALSGLGQELLPQFAIVLASVSYATSAIYGRAFRGMSPVVPACGSLLFGVAVLAPAALIIDRPWNLQPTGTSIMALIVLGVICTAFGNLLYFRLLGTLGSLGTTAQSYLRVPIGVVAGVFLVGETMTPTAGLGLVCVVLGVMAMTWPADKPLPLPWATIDRGVAQGVRGWEWVRNNSPAKALDYALLLLVATLWAGSYVWVKIGLQSIPPLTLMACRIVLAGLLLTQLLRFRGLSLPRDRESWRIYSLQGLLGTVLPFTLVAWGQQWVDAGPAAILNSVTPVFAFLVTWAVTRHEAVTPMKLFGVLAGLAGVAVVMGPGAIFGIGTHALPQIAIVVSAFCYALAAINSRHLSARDPVISATGTLIAAAAIILPFTIVLEAPWNVRPSVAGVMAVLALGIFSTGLGYILYFRLVRSLGTIGITAQSYLRAPIGILLAAVLLGESVTLAMVAGMALVVIGVWAMTRREKSSARVAAAIPAAGAPKVE